MTLREQLSCIIEEVWRSTMGVEQGTDAAIALVVERCAEVADDEANHANECFLRALEGDEGKDRNAARHRTAVRIAVTIRALANEGGE